MPQIALAAHALAGLALFSLAAQAQGAAAPPIEVGGSVDWYYEYNFNHPDRAADGTEHPVQNALRNFDFMSNEVALNLLQFTVKRAPAPVGFRVDLDFGKTADWIHAAEPGGERTYRHIQQAFITLKTRDMGRGATLDLGKFVTSAGAEVIETKDNWNYTRSLLFALAIPYYHAGLRYSRPLSSGRSLRVELTNGWNDVEDNNSAPSLGLTFSTPLGRGVTFTQNYIGGPEQPDDNRDLRHLFDTVVAWTATDRLSLTLNTDYATERRPDGSVAWMGAAAYARCALTDRTALAARLEVFHDPDGAASGTPQTVKEATLTYEWRDRAVTTRAELRHDWSDADTFHAHNHGARNSQTTLLLGSVYAF